MFVKPDTVTPVVRLQLLLAYWQDIYFGQLTELVLIFWFITNLSWTLTEKINMQIIAITANHVLFRNTGHAGMTT